MSGTTDDDAITDHGVLVTAKWEWTTRDSASRWSRPQQGIKPMRVHAPDIQSDPRNDGQAVRYSKLKVRGQGRALVIRYESEDGKDFQILGWSVPFTADTVV